MVAFFEQSHAVYNVDCALCSLFNGLTHAVVVLLTRFGGKVPASPRFPISSISKILSAPKKGAHPIIRRHRATHAAESRNTYQSRAHYSISDNCTSIISGGNDLDEMRRVR